MIATLFFCAVALHCHAQKFAVIGDFGINRTGAKRVSELVKSWTPEFIITLGDNNYYRGYQRTIDRNIGRLYSCYIHPYKGRHGHGADTLRFFPALGNHDVMWQNGKAHFDYFELPGNERYYDFVWGSVHFFVLNSDPSEPDGTTATSIQGQWLKQQLSRSSAPWKVVYFHHPPFSSNHHGNNPWMDWPFKNWGASIVLSGHDHHYERIERNGTIYLVNGLGGAKTHPVQQLVEGSKFQYNARHGAIRAKATETKLSLEFISIDKELIDSVELTKNAKK